MAEFELYTLKEALKDVPPEALQQLCKDRHLRKLAQSLPDWRGVAPFLGLSEAEENMIEEEHTSALGRRIAVLRKWREKHGKKATYERLAKVFCDMGNAALADDVAKVLLQSERDSSEGEPEAFSQKTGSLALMYSIHFLSCVATLRTHILALMCVSLGLFWCRDLVQVCYLVTSSELSDLKNIKY